MTRARVFKSGNRQAVQLPEEFRVNSRELEIFGRGEEIVLREPAESLGRAFELLADFPEDFFPDGRRDTRPQERKGLAGGTVSEP